MLGVKGDCQSKGGREKGEKESAHVFSSGSICANNAPTISDYIFDVLFQRVNNLIS
jgi:hypothetical protein